MPVSGNDPQKCITLSGRVDSDNALSVEKEIGEKLQKLGIEDPVIDVENLDYISSVGLRMILRMKKNYPHLSIINASSGIYEIFDMTGFTQMMDVTKAYRKISVEGCEEVGRGANGILYRMDQENVVKVHSDRDALEEIEHEREKARIAFVLGVPTAISYEVVRVGDHYGSVFELLDAVSFSNILANEPEKMDWCVKEYVKLLRLLHATHAPQGKLPDIRERVLKWLDLAATVLPDDDTQKIRDLVESVPYDDRLIHGDCHTKNILMQNDEAILIDMETLATGHPVFELATMFVAYVGLSELDHRQVMDFQGYDFEISQEFWNRSLAAYLGTGDTEYIGKIEDKVRLVACVRLIYFALSHGWMEKPDGPRNVDFWKERVSVLLGRVDTLLFEVPDV